MFITRADASHIRTVYEERLSPSTGRYAEAAIVALMDAHADLKRDAEHLEALAMNAAHDLRKARAVRDGAQDRAMEYARRADDAVRDATNEREQRRNTEEKLRIVRLQRDESDRKYNVAKSQLQGALTVATRRGEDRDAAKGLLREASAAFEQSEQERNDYARRLKAANADYLAVTKERDDALNNRGQSHYHGRPAREWSEMYISARTKLDGIKAALEKL